MRTKELDTSSLLPHEYVDEHRIPGVVRARIIWWFLAVLKRCPMGVPGVLRYTSQLLGVSRSLEMSTQIFGPRKAERMEGQTGTRYQVRKGSSMLLLAFPLRLSCPKSLLHSGRYHQSSIYIYRLLHCYHALHQRFRSAEPWSLKTALPLDAGGY